MQRRVPALGTLQQSRVPIALGFATKGDSLWEAPAPTALNMVDPAGFELPSSSVGAATTRSRYSSDRCELEGDALGPQALLVLLQRER